jgi:hypothetical protein
VTYPNGQKQEPHAVVASRAAEPSVEKDLHLQPERSFLEVLMRSNFFYLLSLKKTIPAKEKSLTKFIMRHTMSLDNSPLKPCRKRSASEGSVKDR